MLFAVTKQTCPLGIGTSDEPYLHRTQHSISQVLGTVLIETRKPVGVSSIFLDSTYDYIMIASRYASLFK